MALTAEQIRALVPELTEYLAGKASEEMDEAPGGDMPGMDSHAEHGGEEKPDGMGVVIAMKPKGAVGKVAGCPDCADGTPHEHVEK